jgi:hypothetical protein
MIVIFEGTSRRAHAGWMPAASPNRSDYMLMWKRTSGLPVIRLIHEALDALAGQKPGKRLEAVAFMLSLFLILLPLRLLP